jgi:hypothetical protein
LQPVATIAESELERLTRLEQLRARWGGAGFAPPPDHTEVAGRPVIEARDDVPLVEPKFCSFNKAKKQVVITQEISWSPGNGPVRKAIQPGETIAPGAIIAGRIVKEEDLAELLASGCAREEMSMTIRILKWGPIRLGDTCFDCLYGHLAVVPEDMGKRLTTPVGSFKPPAEKICDGLYEGRLEDLPSCPPPRKSPHEFKVPSKPDPTDAFVRLQWLRPPDASIRRGMIDWVKEQAAVDAHITGEGKILDPKGELSPVSLGRLQEGLRRRVPVGSMYMISDGKMNLLASSTSACHVDAPCD